MRDAPLNRFEWLKAVNRSSLLPRAKLVASALAIEFCNHETGRLDPGVRTLADATGQTVDTVKRAIRDLTEGGWLARTEGRGRGNRTEYTLLSPGKVIAMSRPQKGAPVHHEKGGTDAPLEEEKGAPVHGKGGTDALSYNKAEQTREQKARASGDVAQRSDFDDFHFEGNAFAGPVLISQKDWPKLNLWADWLRKEGFPKLCELPISRQSSKNTKYFALPWKSPPEDDRKRAEARRYFVTLIETEGARYAAQ